MNMQHNNEPLLLWWDVVLVAGHVFVRYEKKMCLFEMLQVTLPNMVVCTNKGAQSKNWMWSTIMQLSALLNQCTCNIHMLFYLHEIYKSD
jgi:hypothetical protein